MPPEILRWGFDVFVALFVGGVVAQFTLAHDRRAREVDSIIIRSLEEQLRSKDDELEEAQKTASFWRDYRIYRGRNN